MFKNYVFAAVLALFSVVNALPVAAQRPRAAEDDHNKVVTPPPTAPSTVRAKYEGGVFGYTKKKTGTLTIDSANNRLVFNDKGKELFHIPYGSITGVYGDSHYKQPAAATVASHIPFYGLPASFIKTKVRYLTIQYDDPDSKAAGVTSFRLDNKEILESVLYTVATQAGLKKRGDIYVRKKE